MFQIEAHDDITGIQGNIFEVVSLFARLRPRGFIIKHRLRLRLGRPPQLTDGIMQPAVLGFRPNQDGTGQNNPRRNGTNIDENDRQNSLHIKYLPFMTAF